MSLLLRSFFPPTKKGHDEVLLASVNVVCPTVNNRCYIKRKQHICLWLLLTVTRLAMMPNRLKSDRQIDALGTGKASILSFFGLQYHFKRRLIEGKSCEHPNCLCFPSLWVNKSVAVRRETQNNLCKQYVFWAPKCCLSLFCCFPAFKSQFDCGIHLSLPCNCLLAPSRGSSVVSLSRQTTGWSMHTHTRVPFTV